MPPVHLLPFISRRSAHRKRDRNDSRELDRLVVTRLRMGHCRGRAQFHLRQSRCWQQAVSGSLLSHFGNYEPMILVRPGALNEGVTRHLLMVRPAPGSVNDQLNNHGWILGSLDRMPCAMEADIDLALEPLPRAAR